MTTTPTHDTTSPRPGDKPVVPPPVGRLVRVALIAAALGLLGTGAVLVADPNDQIGAWLQIGAGTGLAATALRPRLWAGGLVAAIAIAAGLVVGHLADYFGAADSTIGPVAIGLTLVLLALSTTAGVAYSRSVR
ncbi:MAG: hypothetical protein WCA82_07985 [Jiangellales bacterium]